MTRGATRGSHALGALLAALALLTRILVPGGFMPVADARGLPTLVMCTGSGPVTVLAPMAMAMPDGEQEGAEGNHNCPFTAVAGAIDLAAPPAQLALFVIAVATALPPLRVRPGLGLAAPPPPKTGPPIAA